MSAPPSDLPDPALVEGALTFTWTDPTGASWRTEPVRQGVAPPPLPLTYMVRVLRDGNQVGVARRKVAATPADGLHVQHITFQITDERAKGSRFPTTYWLASLDQYRSLGIHRVTFLADADGRTFWARDPVRFRNPNQLREMLRNWVAPPNLSPADAAFIARVLAQPETFTPADLYANPIGRLLLTQRSWQAVVDLQGSSDAGRQLGAARVVPDAPYESAASDATPSASFELERLAKLHQDGLLTAEEFSAAKAKLLA